MCFVHTLTKVNDQGAKPASVADGVAHPHEEHCSKNVQQAWHVHPVDVLDRGKKKRGSEMRESLRESESSPVAAT